MDSIIDNQAQQVRNWSARLGALAADANRPHFRQAGENAGLPTRLSTILDSLRRRQETADKLKANQFIMGE